MKCAAFCWLTALSAGPTNHYATLARKKRSIKVPTATQTKVVLCVGMQNQRHKKSRLTISNGKLILLTNKSAATVVNCKWHEHSLQAINGRTRKYAHSWHELKKQTCNKKKSKFKASRIAKLPKQASSQPK